MPTPRSVAQIKSNLLRPSLTSHFEVRIPIPDNVKKNVIEKVGYRLSSTDLDQLNLMCSEVSLPGSSLATLEINNDFTGVTERHVHRRIYDDRIDFTFYVDAEKYLPIIFFESWMKYISGESESVDRTMRGVGSRYSNYFYRVRWPDNYAAQGLQVIKFERDYSSELVYDFIRAYPISIQSMPVSYDSSSLLKCTVSMTYLRYVLTGRPYSPTDPKPVDGSLQQNSTNSDLPNTLGNTETELDRLRALGTIQSLNPTESDLGRRILEGNVRSQTAQQVGAETLRILSR